VWDLIELLVYTCFLVLLTVSLSANPQSYPLFKTKALIENAMSAGAPCVCVCARARLANSCGCLQSGVWSRRRRITGSIGFMTYLHTGMDTPPRSTSAAGRTLNSADL